MQPLREILVSIVLPDGTPPLSGDELAKLQTGVTEHLTVAPVRLSVEQRDVAGEPIPTPDTGAPADATQASAPAPVEADPAAATTPIPAETAPAPGDEPIPAEGAPSPGTTPIPGEHPAHPATPHHPAT